MVRVIVRILVAGLVGLIGCKSNPPLETVDRVDLARYSGRWYEIASFPNSFQDGCVHTTAMYTLLENGKVRVVNRCHDDSPDGKVREIEGTARSVNPPENSKLKVQFFWPFEGDYWILALGDQADYGYALVGTPNRKFLWILSRTPRLDDATYNRLVEIAGQRGFDMSKLRKTMQPG